MDECKIGRQRRARVSFNVTAMIDCTFQLIIFFLLATQLAVAEPQVELPRPHGPVRQREAAGKAVVNVMPYPRHVCRQDPSRKGQVMEYRVGGQRIRTNDTETLLRVLKRLRRQSPAPERFVVELRADRRLAYRGVQPVLAALQRGKLANVHIVALRSNGGER